MRVEGKVVGAIGVGLLVYLGVGVGDTGEDIDWLARKLPVLRVFDDVEGRMNRSVRDIDGGILVISQFTLFGTLKKGNRPSYNHAAPPAEAIPLYELFLSRLEAELGKPVPRGIFGAMMDVDYVNDGPVTLILDTKE